MSGSSGPFTPKHFRTALAALRTRFELQAARSPGLRYDYIQLTPETRDRFGAFRGLRLDDAEATTSGIVGYTVIRDRADNQFPVQFDIGIVPQDTFQDAYFGRGSRAFQRLAAAAAQVFYSVPIPLPVPAAVRAHIGELVPHVTQILPSAAFDESDRWMQYLLWVSWSGSHCLLRDTRETWVAGRRLPHAPDELSRLCLSWPDAGWTKALQGQELPLDHFHCKLDDVYLASVWGIDWLLEQLEGGGTPGAAAPSADADIRAEGELRVPCDEVEGDSKPAPGPGGRPDDPPPDRLRASGAEEEGYWIISSQAQLARAHGYSDHTSRLMERLKAEGVFIYEKVGSKYRVHFLDPAEHERMRREIPRHKKRRPKA